MEDVETKLHVICPWWLNYDGMTQEGLFVFSEWLEFWHFYYRQWVGVHFCIYYKVIVLFWSAERCCKNDIVGHILTTFFAQDMTQAVDFSYHVLTNVSVRRGIT